MTTEYWRSIVTTKNQVVFLYRVLLGIYSQIYQVEPSCMYKHTNKQMCSDWRTKSPLVSVQKKHFYLLFSINKLNCSKAKKNKKSRDTVHSVQCVVCTNIYTYIQTHTHTHTHTHIYTYIYMLCIHTIHTHIYIDIHTYTHIHASHTYTHKIRMRAKE